MTDQIDYSAEAREHMRALNEFFCDMLWKVDAVATQAARHLVFTGEGGAGSARVKIANTGRGVWVCELTCKHIKDTHKGTAHTPAHAVQDSLIALLKSLQEDVAPLGLCLVRFQIAEAVSSVPGKLN